MNDFSGGYIAEMESRMRSQSSWLNFVPTAYWGDFGHGAWPDISLTFDTMLFFFRNEKRGATLDGTRAEPTVKNAPDEFTDMSRRLPAGRKLQVGVYFGAHSTLGDPSAKYDYDLVSLVLNSPLLGGSTAYLVFKKPGVACTGSNYLDDKYCTLQKAYGDAPQPFVSFHKPDGMILSTGNIYFTSHDAFGAHVFRTGQTSIPGQEIELYHEPPGNQFGDIVFADVGGVYYGYFFAVNSLAQYTIKRILLTGSQVATVLTPAFNNIEIVNSHHNLATDGVNLYWQDVSSVKKMPIGGGGITTLDPTTPNTPTAGVYLNNAGNIIYASVAAVRWVPPGGTLTTPLFRTIANANAPVTTILPVANGTYWGDRNGAIQLKLGSTISTIQTNTGMVPTSIGTNIAGGVLVWTQCSSSTCQMAFDFPAGKWVSPVANNALGASMNPSGNVFWGDDFGVHRLSDLHPPVP